MKKLAGKFLYIVVGLVVLVVGCFLVYIEFKEHNGRGHYKKWHSYPFIIAGFGALCIIMAFINDKKPTVDKPVDANQNPVV